MPSLVFLAGPIAGRRYKLADGEYIIIASGKGYVVQLRVPGQELVLSALFDNDATIGTALAMTKRYAQKMSELIK